MMPTTNRFEQRLNNIPNDIWSKIAKIDELKGKWTGGLQASPHFLTRLKRSVLVTSTGASTRIEGARLTDAGVEKLMQGLTVKKWESRDNQEVSGYYELLKNVFDSWKSIPFSESVIKHFHKELLKYAAKDEGHRGQYKKTENAVEMFDPEGKSVGVVFETTKAYLTPKEMQELVEWTQKALEAEQQHPLLVIGNFVVEFLKIHPFQDGNGRLSRMITNLLLLKSGYLYIPYVSHEKLIEANKNAYYAALRQSQKSFGTKKESITPWLDFFLAVILQQSQQAVELLSKEDIEKILSPKQLAVWNYMQDVIEAAPAEIAEKTRVAKPTVYQALIKLIKLKKVERLGLGRSTRYRKIS
jgi:Fic family protein